MKSSGRKIELASASDLFSTEQERQYAKLERLQYIPLSERYLFPDHPFSVKDGDSMMETVESVKERGVLTPAIVRPREGGGCEIVAGHRIPAVLNTGNCHFWALLALFGGVMYKNVRLHSVA